MNAGWINGTASSILVGKVGPMFSLSPETLAAIHACLEAFPEIAWVRIYGSRAMGNYQRGSDIDLTFSSPTDCSTDLLEAPDSLPTPYLFDVTHYDSLKHEGLKAHIDRVGVVIYAPSVVPVPLAVIPSHPRECGGNDGSAEGEA